LTGCSTFENPGLLPNGPIRTQLVREGERVWIQGLDSWSVSKMPNSVVATYSVAARAVGEPLDYDYLMGVSGLAFRLQVDEEMTPSSAHAYCGLIATENLLKALPFPVLTYTAKEDDEDGVAQTRRVVKESIDRGFPVPYGYEENGLIIGYENNGETWLCVHPDHEPAHEIFVEKRWPWEENVLQKVKKETLPDRRRCIKESLALAVEQAKTEKVEDYRCGFNGYAFWISRLRDDAYFAQAEEYQRMDMMQGNCWIYYNLTDARTCAARYLRAIAPEFDLATGERMQKVAALYEKECQVLKIEERTLVAPPTGVLGAKDKVLDKWTNELRHAQADLLTQALEIEKQAVAEIEAMLQGM
jgi:hypothetical protein